MSLNPYIELPLFNEAMIGLYQREKITSLRFFVKSSITAKVLVIFSSECTIFTAETPIIVTPKISLLFSGYRSSPDWEHFVATGSYIDQVQTREINKLN